MDVVAIIPAGTMGKIPGGNFIYCREATHNDFLIQPDGGSKVEFHAGASESFPDDPAEFRVWNNGADLTAKFRVKDGGDYRDNRFLLTGGMDVNNLPATYPDGLTEITRHGYLKKGATEVAVTTTGVAALFTGAVNTNGLILRTLTVIGCSGITPIYSGTAAPANNTDMTKNAILTSYSYQPNQLSEPLYLSAGYGLWLACNGTAGYAWASYDTP